MNRPWMPLGRSSGHSLQWFGEHWMPSKTWNKVISNDGYGSELFLSIFAKGNITPSQESEKNAEYSQWGRWLICVVGDSRLQFSQALPLHGQVPGSNKTPLQTQFDFKKPRLCN